MATTVYVGCALAHAEPTFLAEVDALKAALRAAGYEVLEFVGLDPDASAATVYETDLACATRAAVMVALAAHPSTGLGMELMKRIELGRPTLICYPPTARISRMVLGAAEVESCVTAVPSTRPDAILQALSTTV